MSKPTPGLRKRGEIWHIEKVIAGLRICESTGETDLNKAEHYLAQRTHEIRRVKVYGESPRRTFDEAAAKYVDEAHKKSLGRDLCTLDAIIPYIGHLSLEEVHSGTLDPFVHDRRSAGIAAGTITRDLAVVRLVLKLAHTKWREANGRPWLDSIPLMPSVQGDKRQPRPITHEEQANLFRRLPTYLAEMALFAVHTGCRDQEICGLRWDWEHEITGTESTVFVLPGSVTKNGQERIVPLNTVARSVIEERRGHPGEYVFGRNGNRLQRMNNRAWKEARTDAGLPDVRVHDLRHTFGNRLRFAGVSYEDRQDLLGHHAGRITTHYSQAEIQRLIEAVEMLCDTRKKPEFALVRRNRQNAD